MTDVLTVRQQQILDVLKTGERNVADLAAWLGISAPATVQHLNALRSAGLVARRYEGRFSFYSAVGAR